MNIFRRSVSRFRVLAAIFALIGVTVPVSVIAQENSGEEYSSHALASVWDLGVSSPGEGSLVGSFRVVNDSDSTISGVDYVVTLLSPRPEIQDGELAYDAPHVYSREHVQANIALGPGEEEIVPFTHTVSSLPDEELPYRVRVTLVTSNNRLLDWIDRNVRLAGSEAMFAVLDPIAVLADSVELMPKEDEEYIERSEWAPLEGVRVDPETEIILRSILLNTGREVVDGTIVASFRRDLTTTTDFETRSLTDVTLSLDEEKAIDIPFITPSLPGVYEVFLAVESEEGSRISTVGEFRVVVRGASASIVRVTADEIRLGKGDETVTTVSVVGPPDGSELSGTVEVVLLDGEATVGSSQIGVEFGPSVQSSVFRIPLDRAVEGDLKVRVAMRDEKGVVLDIYELEFSRDLALSSSVKELVESDQSVFLILALIVLVLIAISFIGVYSHRKLRGGNNILPVLVLLSLVTAASGLVYFTNTSEASDWVTERGSWSTTVYEHTGIQAVERGLWDEANGYQTILRLSVMKEVDGQMQEIKVDPSTYVFTVGDEIVYDGKIIALLCGNPQTYYSYWDVFLATDDHPLHGRHYVSRVGDSPHWGPWSIGDERDGYADWERQAEFQEEIFEVYTAEWVSRDGDIFTQFTIEDKHVNEAGEATLGTKTSWYRPIPLNRRWHYHLFTHLAVQEEQPPDPPTVSLSADPNEIFGGQSSTLTWEVENADSCTAFTFRKEYGSDEWEHGDWLDDWRTENVSAPDGLNKDVQFPMETNRMDYTLSLRCKGPGGTTWGSDVVIVNQPAPELQLSECSVSPNPADVNESVTFNVQASGGNGTYQYAWSGDACAGDSGTFYSCGITDIYAEQVPGFANHDIYIRVDNLPLGMDQYGVTGAGTYDNRTFTVVSREPDGSAELKGDLRFNTNARNYFLARKSGISLTDLSGNRICVSLSETPEGAVCGQSFSTEGPKTATVTVTSGNQTRPQTCSVEVDDPNAPGVRFEVDGDEGGTFIKKKGDASTLSWITRNLTSSDQCVASGEWTGIKSALGGSEFKSFSQVGTFIYEILCTRQQDGKTANAEVTIKVTEDGNGVDPEDPKVTLKVDGQEARIYGNTFSKSVGHSSTIAWDTHNLNMNDGDYCEGYDAQSPYIAWNSNKGLPRGDYETDPPFIVGTFAFRIKCYKQGNGGAWVEDYAIISVTDNGGPGNGDPTLPPRPDNGYEERP